MTAAPHQVLDYAPPSNRRWLKRAAILLAIVSALACAAHWWRPLLWKVEILYYQRHCLRYRAPADKVVYNDALSGAGSAMPCSCWEELDWLRGGPKAVRAARSGPPVWPPAVLFLHERRNSHGEVRIVAVLCSKADSPALFGPDGMTKVVVAPATVTRSPVFQEMPRHCVPVVGGPSVRFYAGQPDPKDAAHFTIRCVVTQGKGRAIEHVIDGWLRDDNTVKLVARDPLSEWGEWQGPSGR